MLLLGVAAGVTVIAAVLPSAAAAGTAELRADALAYTAAAGEKNSVQISFRGASFNVSDSAGVSAGPGCSAVNGTTAVCTTSGGGDATAAADLADGDDYAIVTGAPGTLIGGSGNDRLFGSGHDDTLLGGSGADRLEGGIGNDRMVGGSGGDRIVARDAFADRVGCGAGRDTATLDGLDYFGDRCERVKRSDRAGLTVLDVTTTNVGGGAVSLRTACARDAIACTGKATLRERGRKLGSARVAIRRGHTRKISIPLPRDVMDRVRSGAPVTASIAITTDSRRLERTVTLRWRLAPPTG